MLSKIKSLGQMTPIPKDIDSVVTIDTKSECHPEAVGLTQTGVDAIWKSIEDFYRTGLQPGMSIVIRRKGKIVLKRAIGHARGNGPNHISLNPTLMQPDTPVCLFSASKGVTALLIHKLEEDGFLNLDDKVGKYIPEFGVNGKEDTTLRHVLAHRAGLNSIPLPDPDPRLLYQWNTMNDLLAAVSTKKGTGQEQAYHAITGGYILGEIARRVTGKELRPLMQEVFSEPLGCKFFNYGIEESSHHETALNYSTGVPLPYPLSLVAKRALGIEFEKIADISNTPAFMSAIIPAGNMYSTADELCRFYEMMLNQGEFEGRQILKPETVRKAVKPVGKLKLDRTLLIPIRYSSGLMLGESLFSLFGAKAPRAYGHLGLINIVSWADPDRDISVGFLNSGKSLDPRSFPALGKILWSISNHCPPNRSL